MATNNTSHTGVSKPDFEKMLHRLLIQQGPPKKHWEELDKVANNSIFLSLKGGYGGQLCFEWKVQRTSKSKPYLPNQALLAHIERDIKAFETAVSVAIGQPVKWEPNGKGGGDNAIFSLFCPISPNKLEDKITWAEHAYPLFARAIQQHTSTDA